MSMIKLSREFQIAARQSDKRANGLAEVCAALRCDATCVGGCCTGRLVTDGVSLAAVAE